MMLNALASQERDLDELKRVLQRKADKDEVVSLREKLSSLQDRFRSLESEVHQLQQSRKFR